MKKHICINTKCVHAKECVRVQTYLEGKNQEEVISIINPAKLGDGSSCTHLAKRQKVLYAKGFLDIFDELPRRAAREITEELTSIFGKNPYYKMRRGDRLIPPDKQAIIRAVFDRHGIPADTDIFDDMEEHEEWGNWQIKN